MALDALFSADPVITGIFIVLILTSALVWVIIVERILIFSGINQVLRSFEDRFWSGQPWDELSRDLNEDTTQRIGSLQIFMTGVRLMRQEDISQEALKRALDVQVDRFEDYLSKQMPLLALVASTAPYIGLLGTVWGIIGAFDGIAQAQNATLSAIAPGVSEALVATALGLFAAIPAAVAHNRFLVRVEHFIKAADSVADHILEMMAKNSKV